LEFIVSANKKTKQNMKNNSSRLLANNRTSAVERKREEKSSQHTRQHERDDWSGHQEQCSLIDANSFVFVLFVFPVKEE